MQLKKIWPQTLLGKEETRTGSFRDEMELPLSPLQLCHLSRCLGRAYVENAADSLSD